MEKEKKKNSALAVKPKEGKVINIDKEKKVYPWNQKRPEGDFIKDVREMVAHEPKKAIESIHLANRKIHFLNQQLEGAKSELDQFRKNHKILVDQMFNTQKEFKRRSQHNTDEKRTALEEYKRLSSSYSLKEKELAAAQDKVNELKDVLNKVHLDYSNRLEKFKSQYKNQADEREQSITARLSRTHSERQKLGSQIHDLTAELNHARQKVSELQSENSVLLKKQYELERSSKDSVESSDRKKIQLLNLNEKVNDLNRRIASLSTALKLKNDEAETLNTAMNEMKVENKGYNEKLEKYLLETHRLKEALNASKIENETLINKNDFLTDRLDVQGDLTDKIKFYEEEERNLRSEVSSLKFKLEKSNLKLNEYDDQNKSFKKQIEQLENSKADADSVYNTTEARLEKKIEELSFVKREVEQNLKDLKLKYQDIENEVESKTNQLQREQMINNELTEKLRTNSAEKLKLVTKVKDLEEENRVNSKRIIQIKTGIADLKKEISEKNIKVKGLESEIKDSENTREQLTEERNALEVNLANMAREIEEARNEIFQSHEQVNDLNKKITENNQEINDLKSDNTNLEDKIKDLNLNLASEKSKYEALQHELQTSFNDINQLKIKEIDFIEKQQEWIDQREGLELKISNLTTLIEDKDQEINEKQSAVVEYVAFQDKLSDEKSRLVADLQEVENKNKALAFEKEEFVKRIEAFEVEKNKLELELESQREKVRAFEQKINKFELQEARLQDKLDVVEGELATQKKAYMDKDSIHMKEIERIEKTKIKIEEKLAEKNHNIESLQQSEREHLSRIQDLENTNEGQEVQFAKLKEKFENVKKSEEDLTERLEAREEAFGNLEKEFRAKNKNFLKLEKELKGYKLSEEDFKRASEELEERIKENKIIDDKLEVLQAEKDKLQEGLSERHKQLDLYSRWVDSQKESLQKHIVRFVQELKSSIAVNPLKSYLSMTEKEISKTQVVLSKPGVSGAQREHIEQHFKELTKQREYIAQLLKKTEVDIDNRVDEILGLLKQGEFIPVPPLPPESK